MADSATFTIVMSRTIISIPMQRTIRAATRRRSVLILVPFSRCCSPCVESGGPFSTSRAGEIAPEAVEELLSALGPLRVGVEAVEVGALLGEDELRPAGNRGDLDRAE